MKQHFPATVTPEFLLVDLVNNLKELAEDQDELIGRVQEKAVAMNTGALSSAVRRYGGAAARKFFARTLANDRLRHAV
ncbi:MAG: hypothetical protein ACP5IL_13280 [Syntrophobacteraceae bacterium]